MRILMLGNSLTFANDMPQMLAARTGAEVVHHTRGWARLSEQLNPAHGWEPKRRPHSPGNTGIMWCCRR